MIHRDAILAGCCALALAGGGVAVSGCGSAATVVDPVAQAASATTKAGGAQVALSGHIVVAGLLTLKLGGQGHFNFAAHEGAFTMTLSGLPGVARSAIPGGRLVMEELFTGGDLYLATPQLSGKLPGGAHWIDIEASKVAQGAGIDPSSLTSGGADPSQYLQQLASEGAAPRVVGHEAIRGVATTRYAAVIDLKHAAEVQKGSNPAKVRQVIRALEAKGLSAKLPVQVWVDGKGLVRRVATALQEHIKGRSLAADIAVEYFDFGRTPAVSPPPAGETYNATGKALQGLGSALSAG